MKTEEKKGSNGKGSSGKGYGFTLINLWLSEPRTMCY